MIKVKAVSVLLSLVFAVLAAYPAPAAVAPRTKRFIYSEGCFLSSKGSIKAIMSKPIIIYVVENGNG